MTASDPDRNDHVAPRQRALGDFVIERELGRGGMGVVWLAQQRSLGRRVALKTLPDFSTMDPAAVLRFRREAEATGRIAHPGIVPVYGTGDVDGIHWYAMEFIDGPPLGAWIEALSSRQAEKLRGALVEEVQCAATYPAMREPKGAVGNRYVRSCARLCADVANALAAAHRQGVVHRDLKPNNILVHPAGRPVLVDFGLARDERSTGLTRTGEQLGTPAYMAPEQARGSKACDARVDVYGLGAVLYELLTLQPPFVGAAAAEVARQVLSEDPTPVRSRNPNVPVELAAIVHRCLQKDPELRYPAIEALEADLRAFLEGQPVTARLPSRLDRMRAFAQRRQATLLASVGAAAAAAGIAAFVALVGDSGVVRDGERALAGARAALLERGAVHEASDLYARAEALTRRPDLVRAARQRDFADAFETMYAASAEGRAALRRLADAFDDEDRAALRLQLERLEGRGELRPSSRGDEESLAELSVRRVADGVLSPSWQPVEPGAWLVPGEYLVRSVRRDGAQAIAPVLVEADRTTRLRARHHDPAAVPEGHAVAPLPADAVEGEVAVALDETTRAQWRSWLQGLGQAQRAEMTPIVWSEDPSQDELPVRGLSFAQARAFAQAHGARLPSATAAWAAASGGLRGLHWPWGAAFDPARVVADPFVHDEAMACAATPAGASPLGVRHALGNVAEIVAASQDGALVAVGGSFADTGASLGLDGSKARLPEQALSSVFEPSATAGLRLARTLAPAEQPAAAAAWQRRREELERTAQGCVFHDWTLRPDGTLSVRIERVGAYLGGDRRRELRLVTTGFLQVDGTQQAKDGHGADLPTAAGGEPGGESCALATELPELLRPGQGYRFAIRAELQPATGLCAERDAFVLRLPMVRGGAVAQVYTLTLPRGATATAVSPAAETFVEQGRVRLCWEQTAGAQTEAATVRLVVDGGLGGGVPPLRAAATARLQRLLQLWNADDADGLGALLDEDFVLRPKGRSRDEILRGAARDRIELQDVVDVTCVGGVESCEFTARWRSVDSAGKAFLLDGLRLLAQWRTGADGVQRCVRLQPAPRADQGRYVAPMRGDGPVGYANDGMRVQVTPPAASRLVRLQDELCELQVEVQGVAGSARILGCLAAAGEDAVAVRFRLAGAAGAGARAQRLDGGEAADVEDWLFAAPGQVRRERWTFLQRGSRRVLIRCMASGATEAQAQRRFEDEAAQRWFAQLPDALRWL